MTNSEPKTEEIKDQIWNIIKRAYLIDPFRCNDKYIKEDVDQIDQLYREWFKEMLKELPLGMKLFTEYAELFNKLERKEI